LRFILIVIFPIFNFHMTTTKLNLIALADDDADDRDIFMEICDSLDNDIRVLFFENGLQLLDYLVKKNTTLPSTLFLDINMPVKDGFDCLKEIRDERKFNDIRIIIYSTSITTSDVNKSRRLGADRFLQKPSDFYKLVQVVKDILDIDWENQYNSSSQSNFLVLPT